MFNMRTHLYLSWLSYYTLISKKKRLFLKTEGWFCSTFQTLSSRAHPMFWIRRRLQRICFKNINERQIRRCIRKIQRNSQSMEWFQFSLFFARNILLKSLFILIIFVYLYLLSTHSSDFHMHRFFLQINSRFLKNI